MKKRGSWHLLSGVVIGTLLGMIFSLLVLPIQYSDTGPATLTLADKETYRKAIARAYLVEADNARALARIALLDEQDPADGLVIQAQQEMAAGGEEDDARILALLVALIDQPSISITPVPFTLSTSTPTATEVRTIEPTPTAPPPTHTLAATSTRFPTSTPDPTQAVRFNLVDQSTVCDVSLSAALIQVFVMDAGGGGMAGIKIEISIPDGGTETFFTGFYPEIDPGYADYVMLPGMVYKLHVGEFGELLENLAIPDCENDLGEIYPGSIRLEFQPQQ